MYQHNAYPLTSKVCIILAKNGRMFAFLALLFIVMVIYLITSNPQKSEGFDTLNTPISHKVNIPINIIPPSVAPPPARSIDDSNVQPSNLPGSLPIAPYEQIASMSPLPYQDTSLIKANRQQLVSILELLKGFLAFEAQEISERSDPTIQLPLNTARSDFHTLQAQIDVLNRNPGLQTTITLTQLNEISSNLAYLQREVRLIGAAGPIQGPIYEFTQPINVSKSTLEGFDDMTGQKGGQRATLDDLNKFVVRISSEILRLSASGTTDPVIQARITALTEMRSNVQTIISQVQTGALLPVQIPIMKDDIDNALKNLGKPSEPLPQIIKTLGLPAGLANLLPSNIQNDPNTVQQINNLINTYGQKIIDAVTASFAVNYANPQSADSKTTIDTTGFPSVADLNNVSNNKFIPVAVSGDTPVTDRLAPTPMDAGRGPSHFDWKTRAKEIEDQIKKRGLNPKDFGITPSIGTSQTVSNEFSWKGYTRMICTRLQATMDPGLPESCGCPPMDWNGWRIAK